MWMDMMKQLIQFMSLWDVFIMDVHRVMILYNTIQNVKKHSEDYIWKPRCKTVVIMKECDYIEKNISNNTPEN